MARSSWALVDLVAAGVMLSSLAVRSFAASVVDELTSASGVEDVVSAPERDVPALIGPEPPIDLLVELGRAVSEDEGRGRAQDDFDVAPEEDFADDETLADEADESDWDDSDEEHELLEQELDSDAEDWARSANDGWYDPESPEDEPDR